jgi:predicted ATP-dependent serine protease
MGENADSSRGKHSSNAPDGAGESRCRTSIPGLDDILGGGFTRDRLYLIDGDPGAGKTTRTRRARRSITTARQRAR